MWLAEVPSQRPTPPGFTEGDLAVELAEMQQSREILEDYGLPLREPQPERPIPEWAIVLGK